MIARFLDVFRSAASRERVCFLHVGPHKTGTTSIQYALFRASRSLARRGYLYPRLTNLSSGHPYESHIALTRAENFARPDLADAPAWRELAARIEGARKIVVSAEHFSETLREESRYERVIDFFVSRGFRVIVVAYIRDQPAWLNSWYTQDQRNFRSRRTIEEFATLAFERGLMDPEAYLARPIADERVEIRVVPFETAAKKGLVRDFLSVIGAPVPFRFQEPEPANPNVGAKGVFASQEIMRRVGGGVRTLPDYPQLYETYKALTASRGWQATPYVGVTPELEERIRAHHADANEAFAQEWFDTDWESLCAKKVLKASVFDPETASEAERADVAEVVDAMVALIEASKARVRAERDAEREARRARVAARDARRAQGAAKTAAEIERRKEVRIASGQARRAKAERVAAREKRRAGKPGRKGAKHAGPPAGA